MATIDELLNSLQNPNSPGTLENTAETWARIGNKDVFAELGLESSELEAFLTDWASNNDYNNI
tara:strand:+ start:701 stop:889 length:189 start_codon:yes stop_codon:yes gene_type:complete